MCLGALWGEHSLKVARSAHAVQRLPQRTRLLHDCFTIAFSAPARLVQGGRGARAQHLACDRLLNRLHALPHFAMRSSARCVGLLGLVRCAVVLITALWILRVPSRGGSWHWHVAWPQPVTLGTPVAQAIPAAPASGHGHRRVPQGPAPGPPRRLWAPGSHLPARAPAGAASLPPAYGVGALPPLLLLVISGAAATAWAVAQRRRRLFAPMNWDHTHDSGPSQRPELPIASESPDPFARAAAVSRRAALGSPAAAAGLAHWGGGGYAAEALGPPEVTPEPYFMQPGPYATARVQVPERACAAATGTCGLRGYVAYPLTPASGGAGDRPCAALGPAPVVVISPGFTVKFDQYASYADHLASHGYVAVTYSTSETQTRPLTDVRQARLLQALLDDLPGLCPTVSCDSDAVMVVGHSRGGKVAVLAAAVDPRIRALVLLDPVDTTAFAPLAPGFPSAVAALAAASGHSTAPGALEVRFSHSPPPVVVVGGGRSRDCVPAEANYSRFFDAAPAPALEVVLPEAGHLQFLDYQSFAQESACAKGRLSNAAVCRVARGITVACAGALLRGQCGHPSLECDTTPRSLSRSPSPSINTSTSTSTTQTDSHNPRTSPSFVLDPAAVGSIAQDLQQASAEASLGPGVQLRIRSKVQ